MVERETNRKLVTLRADNGGEYVNKQFQDFCASRGIRLETTSARTPEQNGIGERQNRSVFDRVRTALINAQLPLSLWAEGVNYVVYTKNRTPTSALRGLTPYEARFDRTPNYRFLHRFGCRAFVYNDHPDRTTLDPRANEGVFVGYADTQKAYRVYFPSTRKLVSSIHVKFNDDINGYTGTLAKGENTYDSFFRSPTSSADDESSSSSSVQAPIVPVPPQPVPAVDVPPAPPSPQPAPAPARPRGRPKGSKNKRGGEPTRRSSRIQENAAPAPQDAPAAPVAPDPGPGGVPRTTVEDVPDEDDPFGPNLRSR